MKALQTVIELNKSGVSALDAPMIDALQSVIDKAPDIERTLELFAQLIDTADNLMLFGKMSLNDRTARGNLIIECRNSLESLK